MESGSPIAEMIFQEKLKELEGFRIYSFSKQPQKLVYIVEMAVLKAYVLRNI